MELLKDYDMSIQNYLGKANVVEDTLSQKFVSTYSLAYMKVSRQPFAREIQTLAILLTQFSVFERGKVLASVEVRSTFLNKVKAK